MDQETYHSSTLGEIPLSFTGRRLLQNLREAIEEYTTGAVKGWEPLSRARGKIAKYMSELERGRQLNHITDEELLKEVERRLMERIS